MYINLKNKKYLNNKNVCVKRNTVTFFYFTQTTLKLK